MAKCKKCGHYSVIRGENKEALIGCSGVRLIMEEEFRQIRSASFPTDQKGKERKFEFEPIDTTFSLNKDGNCFLWTEQTNSQKSRLKEMYGTFINRVMGKIA